MRQSLKSTTAMLLAGVALGSLFSTASMAQTTDAPVSAQAEQSASSSEETTVVVTGTRIRGLKTPTGSNLVTVNADTIKATGAPSATELLSQTVTQLPTFNTMPVGSPGSANTTARLGLRGFGNSAGNASGGTATLVLFNGHRVVFTGVGSSDVDPSSIPTDILDTVQVMPDGGSAAYGSDASGGVINFVTKKRFDGVQLHVQTGVADHYHENIDTLMAGRSWSGGGLLVSTSFSNNSTLLNKYRPYTSVDYTDHGGLDYRKTACPYGSFTVNGAAYAAPSFSALAAQPVCEPNANSSMVPEQTRVSGFMYFEQKLTDKLKFSMDGFYSNRNSKYYHDLNAMGSTVTIDASNPNFHPVQGETSQTVSFSYANALGANIYSPQEMTSWQLSPKLEYRLNDNWIIEADMLYGWSKADIHDRSAISTAAVTSTNVNPYDTSKMDPVIIGSLANFEWLSVGENKVASAQISANGTLFSLPGGDVRAAFGVEATKQNLDTWTARGPINTTPLSYLGNERKLEAVYGELYVPIVGEQNSRPGLRSLDLALAVRYDHYSDFGGTTNPRIGVNYKPFDDFNIRANYQTTFSAASLADSGLKANVLQTLFVAPGVYKLYVAGTGAKIQPTTSKNYSIGADWTPNYAPGLRVSATYWNDKLENIISQALAAYGGSAFASRTAYALCGVGYAQYGASANGACTQAQVQSIQDTLGGGQFQSAPGINSIADLFQPGVTIATLIDARRGNFGLEHISGIDFETSYNWKMPIGSAFVSLGGTYILEKKIAATATAPFVDYLNGDTVNPQTSPYGFTATFGLTHGGLSGRLNVTHSGGYDIPPGTVGQTSIGSFTLTNLSVSDEIGGFAGLNDNVLELTVNNVFDTEPPWNSAQGTSGYPAAGTIGRLVRLGIRSKF